MIVFATLTLVDYGIFLVLILSAILSTLRGITRELLGLAGWVASILVAKFTAPMIETPIADFLQVQALGVALAWALPFAASVVIWFILASLLAPGLKRVGFGNLDRWLGVLFGLIRGFGLVLIVFVAAVFAAEGEDNLPDIIKDSHSSPALSRAAYYFSGFAPKNYREKLIENLNYRGPLTASLGSQDFDPPIEVGKDALDSGMDLLSDEKAN